MSNLSISVRYTATTADYRQVLLWYLWKRLVIVAVSYALLVGIIAFALGYGAGGPTNSVEGRGPSLAFFWLLMLPLLIGISAYFSIWRQASKTAKLTEPATATFRCNGIKIETPSSTTERIWETFNRVYETESHFIFFPFKNVFYTIPKRYFDSQEELELVKGILRSGLGNKAILKR